MTTSIIDGRIEAAEREQAALAAAAQKQGCGDDA